MPQNVETVYDATYVQLGKGDIHVFTVPYA